MRVVVVEDDGWQADSLESTIKHHFRDPTIIRLTSENAFSREFDLLQEELPDLILLDIMLRWSEPAPDMPEPPTEVKEEGFFRGGLRCLDKLLKTEATSKVPVILYSVVERQDIGEKDLPPNVVFVQKGSGEAKLIRNMRSMLHGGGNEVSLPRLSQRAWNALETKPGWLGFAVDLKKLLGRAEKPGD